MICCIIRNRERDDEKSVQNGNYETNSVEKIENLIRIYLVELTTRQSATTVNSAPFE